MAVNMPQYKEVFSYSYLHLKHFYPNNNNLFNKKTYLLGWFVYSEFAILLILWHWKENYQICFFINIYFS